MAFSKVVKADTIRTVANGSITNAFTVVGSALAHGARMIRFINNTDQDMFFSDDGTNSKYFVPKTSFVLYDLSANTGVIDTSSPFVYPIGTQFYVKYSSAPSTGAVYIEIIYANGE